MLRSTMSPMSLCRGGVLNLPSRHLYKIKADSRYLDKECGVLGSGDPEIGFDNIDSSYKVY